MWVVLGGFFFRPELVEQGNSRLYLTLSAFSPKDIKRYDPPSPVPRALKCSLHRLARPRRAGLTMSFGSYGGLNTQFQSLRSFHCPPSES